MTLTDQKKQLTKTLKTIHLQTMDQAKGAIMNLILIQNAGRAPTFNDLMEFLNRPKISYGDEWAWKDLQYDILSNKYGSKCLFDQRTKKSTFALYLPPVEHINKKETEV